jgi:hypothetical protein
MFAHPDRISRYVATATLAFLIAGCAGETTAPISREIQPRATVTPTPGYLIDTGQGGTSSIGYPSLFAAGSTGCSPQPSCASNYQFLGGKFTLTHEAMVESVEGWLNVNIAGSVAVFIRADSVPASGATVPGPRVLQTATYALTNQAFGWKVFTNFNVDLPAGTYWLTLEPVANSQFNGGMSGGAASPLADYAFNANGNNRWVPYSAFAQNPALGMRVYGTVVVTASDMINDLKTYVNGSSIPRPNAKKIIQKLDLALSALAANQTSAACTDMQDVIDYTNAQSVRKIAADVKASIISQSTDIRTKIGC